MPMLGAPAMTQPNWQPLPAHQDPSPESPSKGPLFLPVPSAEVEQSNGQAPIWLPVQEDTTNSSQSTPIWTAVDPLDPNLEVPTSAAEIPAATPGPIMPALLLKASDYLPLLRLGTAVPTANQLADQSWQFSFGQLAPLAGGGAAGGSGNQNYYGRFDAGISDRLQFSAFYSVADDPLFAPINGLGKPFNISNQPANFFEAFGGALQWQLAKSETWKLGLTGSLEEFNVGSGGCDSFSCKDNSSYSPNIFNNSGSRVFSRNLVGSLGLPLSWQAAQTIQFTFTPGVSFLPSNQGSGQGGAGLFYGTNITVAGGLSWRVAPQLTLFGSGLIPLGPGNNSFDANLDFSRVPIFTAGINYAINPRIALEGALTNGWGATPATAVLALPSSNQLGFTGRFIYNPGALDSAPLVMNDRQRSLALGGLSVNTAQVPAEGTRELWANGDSEGNVFGFFGYSLSNDFQLQYSGGIFNNVQPITALSSSYATDRGYNERIGGKAIVLNQLRGAPLSIGGRITVGRNKDPASYQGYVFFETINTWEATPWLALNLNPKLAWSGESSPWGLGVSANIQLGQSFQLIPELNLVASDTGASNGTLALRWLANKHSNFELYVSNAAGLLDMGQLMGSSQVRIGGRLLLSF